MDATTKIVKIINVFETGTPDGDYSNVSIYPDLRIGGKKVYQITYGRSQTTEGGNLKTLLEMYISKNGLYAESLMPFMSKIGLINGKATLLSTDDEFIALLKKSGKDDIMIKTQDLFFDEVYFSRAVNFWKENGFKEFLSLAVIYDSYIHSNQIFPFLRNRFKEVPPAQGGNERIWIESYCRVRLKWLSTHRDTLLHRTVYRMEFFLEAIENDNWDLSKITIEKGKLLLDY